MFSKIWFDGTMLEWDDAKINVMCHTLHYGSGAFEGIRFYKTPKGRAVFRLDEHLDRFFYSMQVLNMPEKWNKQEIKNAVVDVVRSCPADEGYIRPIAFYGEGLGLVPKEKEMHIAIGAWKWGAYLGKESVNVQISKIKRISPMATDIHAKLCGNYINSVLASLSIDRDRFDEALMLDHEGFVAEGPGENIFGVKDNVLFAISSDSILPGITRNSIITLAKEEGIEVEERKMRIDELLSCEELFFCGTAVEVCAIVRIDDVVIGDGKMGEITKKMKDLYLKEVRGRGRHDEWLTYVD